MRRPTKGWTDKVRTRRGTPEIDVTLPGFGAMTGRDSDRVRLASRTRNPEIFYRRRGLVSWLFEQHHERVIVALLDKRTTWPIVERAQAKGPAALRALTSTVGTPLLEKQVAAYIATYRRKGKGTVEKQLKVFVAWCQKALGGRAPTLGDIDTSRVMTFLSSIGRQDNKRSLTALSTATLNRYRAALSGFFVWAVTHGRMPEHPIAGGKIKRFTEHNERMPVMLPADVRQYLNLVYSTSLRRVPPEHMDLRALVLALCITTGADVSEITALKRAHLQVMGTGAWLVLKRRKTTTGERMVPLAHPHLVKHLTRVLDEQRAAFSKVSVHHLWPLHRHVRAAIGQDALSIKDLRHISAQMWRRAGADLQQVCDWLGHASLEYTRIYAAFGPDEEMDTPVTRKLGALLGVAGEVAAPPLSDASAAGAVSAVSVSPPAPLLLPTSSTAA